MNRFLQGLPKWLLRGALLVVGVYVSLLIIDLLTGWGLYSFFYRRLYGIGMPEYLSGIVSVWLMVWLFVMLPTIVTGILTRRRDWIYKVAFVVTVWFGLMYALSFPYTGKLFNPWTGDPNYRYVKTSDGTIKKFPKGLRFDPDTGQELQVFDPATAEEYLKQEAARQDKPEAHADQPGLLDQIKEGLGLGSSAITAGSTNEHQAVALTVEKVQLAPDRVVLHLSVRSTLSGEDWAGLFEPNSEWVYLSDQTGQIYSLVGNNVVYDRYLTYGKWFLSKTYKGRIIKPGEIYRFTYVFEPLDKGAVGVVFHPDTFETVELDSLLAKAEKLPALPVKKKQPQEPSAPPPSAIASAPAKPAYTPPPEPLMPAVTKYDVFMNTVFSHSRDIPEVMLWVESVEVSSISTVLNITVKSAKEGEKAYLFSPKMQKHEGGMRMERQFDAAYLADEDGQTYEYILDSLAYHKYPNTGTWEKFRWEELFVYDIRPYEVLRFRMEFGPIKKTELFSLKFFHRQFGTMTLKLTKVVGSSAPAQPEVRTSNGNYKLQMEPVISVNRMEPVISTDSGRDLPRLLLWVEEVEVTSAATVLHLAVKPERPQATYLYSPVPQNPGTLKAEEPFDPAYLVDQAGNTYEYASDSLTYYRYGNVWTLVDFYVHDVGPSQLLRFTMRFRPLKKEATELKFFHRQFEDPIRIPLKSAG